MFALSPGACATQLASIQDTADSPCPAAPNSNFWRRCSWSADGTHALAVQDDSIIQVLTPPPVTTDSSHAGPAGARFYPVRRIPQGENLYDCAFYPCFCSSEPQSACFAASCKGQPVHLWDCFSGTQRATYRTYNQADEVATAHSLQFHPDGERCASWLPIEGWEEDTVMSHYPCRSLCTSGCHLCHRRYRPSHGAEYR